MKLVLCEGLTDRRFLRGFLENQGCQWAGRVNRIHQESDDYQFKAPSAEEVLIRPIHGGFEKQVSRLRNVVKDPDRQPSQVFFVVDLDDNDPQLFGPEKKQLLASEFPQLQCELIYWSTDQSGLNTLEKLIFESLSDIVKAQTDDVESWLGDKLLTPGRPFSDFWPAPTQSCHTKGLLSTLASSHYPKAGDRFFEWVWSIPSVAEAMQKRLVQTGMWAPLLQMAQ